MMGDKMSIKLFKIYLIIVMIWIIFALTLDVVMITLHFMDREDLSKQLISKITKYE